MNSDTDLYPSGTEKYYTIFIIIINNSVLFY